MAKPAAAAKTKKKIKRVVTDGVAHVRAGAGVVHDSDPLAEADETRRKAAAVLSAIRSTEMAA